MKIKTSKGVYNIPGWWISVTILCGDDEEANKVLKELHENN